MKKNLQSAFTTFRTNPVALTRIYDLLCACSQARTPKEFIQALFAQLAEKCPYDQAIAFFFDRNGKISDVYTLGTRPGWLETYLNYYIETADVAAIGMDMRPTSENEKQEPFDITEWDRLPVSEFKRDYIDPVNLKYTLSFSFFDMSGGIRAAICLDRCTKKPFRPEELELLEWSLPVLTNMHRNFFYKDVENVETASLWEAYRLTKREAEIADMLCQGMKAARISATLFIAEATTHKHIAHIYRKAGVSSQQELIARVLSRRALQ
ncbi:MAG: helix-turn-helix transcriptional regulator [Firmicutes bacterium]|nr:helix-turn-helix transcriptional regulator [Bacillota bacterium]